MRSPAARSAASESRHVVVELEVLVPLPAARDLDGARVGRVGVAAHAAHDPLGEAEPDLVVVLELGMAAQVDQGGIASRLVAGGVEREPVALACAHVALRPELGPGPRKREVDVEENGPQLSHSTVLVWWLAPSAQATVCTIVQPRARSRSRPSSAQRRSSR